MHQNYAETVAAVTAKVTAKERLGIYLAFLIVLLKLENEDCITKSSATKTIHKLAAEIYFHPLSVAVSQCLTVPQIGRAKDTLTKLQSVSLDPEKLKEIRAELDLVGRTCAAIESGHSRDRVTLNILKETFAELLDTAGQEAR